MDGEAGEADGGSGAADAGGSGRAGGDPAEAAVSVGASGVRAAVRAAGRRSDWVGCSDVGPWSCASSWGGKRTTTPVPPRDDGR
ncbi:hypothetical protein [Streptomyces hebeiensis]|uniref:hypothetical protein n=1 Tax=Streptomyces hebeiensis TaxID=229486 RepID=UPI0031D5B797